MVVAKQGLITFHMKWHHKTMIWTRRFKRLRQGLRGSIWIDIRTWPYPTHCPPAVVVVGGGRRRRRSWNNLKNDKTKKRDDYLSMTATKPRSFAVFFSPTNSSPPLSLLLDSLSLSHTLPLSLAPLSLFLRFSLSLSLLPCVMENKKGGRGKPRPLAWKGKLWVLSLTRPSTTLNLQPTLENTNANH